MTDNGLLERITIDPKVMTGKPVIRGTRLAPEDIQACLLFASKSLESTSFVPLVAECEKKQYETGMESNVALAQHGTT